MQSKDLLQLAQEFGNSLYVYDAKVDEQEYNRLVASFSTLEKLRINNAMKERYRLIFKSNNQLS